MLARKLFLSIATVPLLLATLAVPALAQGFLAHTPAVDADARILLGSLVNAWSPILENAEVPVKPGQIRLGAPARLGNHTLEYPVLYEGTALTGVSLAVTAGKKEGALPAFSVNVRNRSLPVGERGDSLVNPGGDVRRAFGEMVRKAVVYGLFADRLPETEVPSEGGLAAETAHGLRRMLRSLALRQNAADVTRLPDFARIAIEIGDVIERQPVDGGEGENNVWTPVKLSKGPRGLSGLVRVGKEREDHTTFSIEGLDPATGAGTLIVDRITGGERDWLGTVQTPSDPRASATFVPGHPRMGAQSPFKHLTATPNKLRLRDVVRRLRPTPGPKVSRTR